MKSPVTIGLQCLVLTAVGISAVAGCSPLPGTALDPLYLRIGAAPTANTAPGPLAAAPPASRIDTSADTNAVWAGRYRDTRGGGEIVLSVVQRDATLSGTWKLRTGGGGPFTGTWATGGRRLTFRMENAAHECRGTFEGWAEADETTLLGAYHGRDCQGAVTDGRLDLHRQQSERPPPVDR